MLWYFNWIQSRFTSPDLIWTLTYFWPLGIYQQASTMAICIDLMHYHAFIHFFSASMGQVYEEHKDEDGFLYIAYSGENTFGRCWNRHLHLFSCFHGYCVLFTVTDHLIFQFRQIFSLLKTLLDWNFSCFDFVLKEDFLQLTVLLAYHPFYLLNVCWCQCYFYLVIGVKALV